MDFNIYLHLVKYGSEIFQEKTSSFRYYTEAIGIEII
jgi:hypothetical protein